MRSTRVTAEVTKGPMSRIQLDQYEVRHKRNAIRLALDGPEGLKNIRSRHLTCNTARSAHMSESHFTHYKRSGDIANLWIVLRMCRETMQAGPTYASGIPAASHSSTMSA